MLVGALLQANCGPSRLDAFELTHCHPESADNTNLPGGVALPAAAFLDSLGLRVSLQVPDSAYQSSPQLLEHLRRLRVSHLRDDAPPPGDGAAYRELAASDIGFLLQLSTRSDVASLVTEVGDGLEGVQVPTPGDGASGSPETSATLENTKSVATQVSILGGGPAIVGPMLRYREGAERVPVLSEWVDYGTVRYGPRPPGGAWLDDELAAANQWFPKLPLLATQGGSLPTLAGSSEPPVSEDVQAKYLLRMYLEMYRRGVTRTYYPALYDDDFGSGLLRSDGSEKPAFQALEAMAAMLDSEPTDVAQVAGLSFGLSDPDARGLLLQKNPGQSVLVLWLEVPSMPGAVVERPVTVTINPSPLSVAVHSLVNAPTVAALKPSSELSVIASDSPSALVLEMPCLP